MTPATVNAYFNPPANEVGLLVLARFDVYLREPSRSYSLRASSVLLFSTKIGLATSSMGPLVKSRHTSLLCVPICIFGRQHAHFVHYQHAFDSAGRLYNQEGKLEEWWTNATSERFEEKQSCLEKQFSCV